MAGGTEEAVLADRGMRSNAYLVHAIAINFFTQARVIAHLKVPRRPYPSRWIRMNLLAEFCAEETQQ